MARVGILSAMPVELEDLLGRVGAKEIEKKGFFKLYEGSLNGHEVILACSGIGKVNAAACTQHLIDCYAVDCVINMGIAGGITDALRTLDVLVGTEIIYHDFHPAELLDRNYPFTGVFACDKHLSELAVKACKVCPEVAAWHRGRVASGDCFVEDSATRERIRSLGGVCCEMEGVAVGQVCYNNGVPFLVLRSISDFADEAANVSYDEFEKKAALQSNRIVEGMLALL